MEIMGAKAARDLAQDLNTKVIKQHGPGLLEDACRDRRQLISV